MNTLEARIQEALQELHAATTPAERAHALNLLAQNQLIGDPEKSLAYAEESAEIARQNGLTQLLGAALTHRARALRFLNRFQEALQALDASEACATQVADARTVLNCKFSRAFIYRSDLGNPLEAFRIAYEMKGQYLALEALENPADRARLEMHVLDLLATCYTSLGDVASEYEMRSQAIDLANAYNLEAEKSPILTPMAITCMRMGDKQRAVAVSEEAIHFADHAEIPWEEFRVWDQFTARLGAGELFVDCQEWEKALAYLNDAAVVFQDIPVAERWPGWENNLKGLFAMCYLGTGRLDLAEENIAQAVATMGDAKDQYFETILLRAGEVYLRVGKFEEALTHVERALATVREKGKRTEELILCDIMVRIHEARNDFASALEFSKRHTMLAKEINQFETDLRAKHVAAMQEIAQARHARELERVRAERAEEIARIKSKFFSDISHEFRTPLTLILSPLEEMMATGVLEPGRVKLMLRNGRRVLSLVSQILDLSRIESGELPLRTSPGDLAAFTRVIGASFQSLAESHDIGFELDIAPAPIPMMFDAEKVERVIVNLLSNAFKFTPAGGTVRLSVKHCTAPERAPSVSIAVHDTGIGIAAEEQQKIFDRFYQAGASASRAHEGAGIGLALSKELAILHGGTIAVESQPGIGSTFTVSLPLVLPDAGALAATVQPVTVRADETAETESEESILSLAQDLSSDLPLVLVVEDNADLREYLCDTLAAHYRVINAANGAEGAARTLESMPDLIVSDVMMPGMNGYELCAQVKGDERTSHVPVILLTARADRESRLEGLGTGADDYVVKPFDAEELRLRIKNLIEQRRNLRERFRTQFVLAPTPATARSAEELFLLRVRDAIERNMSDEHFTVETLVHEVAMSRAHLHRKLQALTNRSARQLITDMRLERAHALLAAGAGRVSEIAYQVGFSSHTYFTRRFKERFGYAPSELPAIPTPTAAPR
jgi:signal transduction histidine kinase/DNA-binding response OmpR family regulator